MRGSGGEASKDPRPPSLVIEEVVIEAGAVIGGNDIERAPRCTAAVTKINSIRISV